MRRLAIFLLSLFFAISTPVVAFGQATQSFSPTALPTAFSVSTSTARIPFPSPGPTAVIVNTSTTITAYINMGSSTITAATTDYILGPGCAVAYNISGKPYLAAITATGSATLQVSSGSGLPTLPQTNCVVAIGGTFVVTVGPPYPTTPSAATSSTLTTGGVAQTIVTGAVSGCYVVNPASAGDQGIVAIENIVVNGVTTASATGNGTNSTIAPGQTWACVPGQTTNVSAIAATSGHRISVVKW